MRRVGVVGPRPRHGPTRPLDPSVAGGETCDSDAVLRQIDDLYQGFKRDVIIATVSDPIDSQAGWLFDAQLEAIVGAIERKILVESAGAESDADSGQLNYTRDRYVLPWNCVARAGERAPGAAGGKRSVDPREIPGLVVFRNRNQKRLLLLFLIGETPTFGIHAIALSRAQGLRTHDADTPHGAHLHGVGHVAARRHRALVGK